MTIGSGIYRFRWQVVGFWLAAVVALGVFVGPIDPTAVRETNFLPASSDHARAAAALGECFPDASGLSEAAIVFERTDAQLTAADLRAIESVAAAILRPDPPAVSRDDLAGVKVRSPARIPLPANPLKSPDSLAALVIVHVPANFITVRSARLVDHVRRCVARAKLPAGLAASVSGASGFGHDYAAAAERSHRRTLTVTLIAVLGILLVVYRSPVAALVPLLAVSAAAFVAMKLLALARYVGLHVGTGEKVFVVALTYGAGMDYSLLFISRCREFLDEHRPPAQAVARGLGATFWAILASAGTDTVGLLMLCFADYGAFRSAGPAIAAALVVALLAAATLTPAIVGVLGRATYWPAKHMGQLGARRLWPAVASAVTARPGWVLAVTAVLLAVPAARALRLTWVYDALAELPAARPEGVGNAAAGIAAARRHWAAGQIAPVTVLVRAKQPVSDEKWHALARKLTRAVADVPGVRDVRSLAQPVGRDADLVSRALLVAAASKVRAEFLSNRAPAMRLVVILDEPAFSLGSLEAVEQIRQIVRAAVPAANVHLAGATAEMIDIRRITQSDFRRIAVGVLGVIFLMVLALLRDPALAAFMVAGTVLSYLATLGLSAWAFAAVGAGGLDWKVEVFLFVVMVAVGVDYSIFLAARVAQEARTTAAREAVRRAVVHTGPVISSCGVIMAATTGSLMAGELKLLVQLGFALALGMLIDTFIVRPLLLPAFIALTGRTGRIPKFLEG